MKNRSPDITPERDRSLSYWVALACIGGIPVGIGLVASPRLLMTALGLCCMLVLIIPLFRRQTIDVFEPPVLLGLPVFIGVVLRTAVILWSENPELEAYHLLGEPPAILLPALVIILVGLVALVLGYLFPIKVQLKSLPFVSRDVWRANRLTILGIIVLILAGAAAVDYARRISFWSPLSGGIFSKRFVELQDARWKYATLGYHKWLTDLSSLLFLFMVAWFAERKESLLSVRGVILIGSLVIPVFCGVMLSSRSTMLYPIVLGTLAWHLLRRRIPLRSAVVLLLTGVVLWAGLGVWRAASQGKSIQWDFTGRHSLGGALSWNRNWMGVAKTAHIVKQIPDNIPYEFGRTFALPVVAPIPRNLWRGKPIVRVGKIIGPLIYGFQGRRTGVPPGMLGEYYWNFGLPGVITGMFLMGVVLRFLYTNLGPGAAPNKSAIVLYILLVVPLALRFPGTDFTGLVALVGKYAVPAIIFLLLCARESEKEDEKA